MSDTRLIEHNFPCHQVGAETQRERGASSALPPLYFLHVWWARRPLTPSRAAIQGSLLPGDTDPDLFLRDLGIEKVQAILNGIPWTLTDKLVKKLESETSSEILPETSGAEILRVDAVVIRAFQKEEEWRAANRESVARIRDKAPELSEDPAILRWEEESQAFPIPWPELGDVLQVRRVMGDPAWCKRLIAIAKRFGIRISNLYGYKRSFANLRPPAFSDKTILDPTSGGGSIPFEALRLGHQVIANDLSPVATVILHATLDYPARFGPGLSRDIRHWGEKLRADADEKLAGCFPGDQPLPPEERAVLEKALSTCPEHSEEFKLAHPVDFLYARQVICPHCRGEAPLLNACWLSKIAGDAWGVRIIPDGRRQNGKVRFETYRVHDGKGPNDEDPNFATVRRGVGLCIHCRQAISGDEIKAQAKGESELGKWKNRLYCVVADRSEPVLSSEGSPQQFKSGPNKGKTRTRKIRFFRAPDDADFTALAEAEKCLNEKWEEWEARGLIPTEKIPFGQKTSEPLRYGFSRWCEMFTPRQLLGHLTLAEGLNRLRPRIIEALGPEKGRAVVTYLQFAIDKGVDYNSQQTRWHYTRKVMVGSFGRHDFSLKWTFGEISFVGPGAGPAWALSQITDAYEGIAALVRPLRSQASGNEKTFSPLRQAQIPPVRIFNGTASHMPGIPDQSVDLVCMDPPYYDNVQYAELSDYFYVWQKRTLRELYPEIFSRRLTNKREEAVANPSRDGSAKEAKQTYENMMRDIFSECFRVLRPDGLMTLMFTHKSQDAWETLTRSLIESGWVITATVPVESEARDSIHQKNLAAAASSIFISCRKRTRAGDFPSPWTGIGGTGVQHQIRDAVEQGLGEFAPLRLSPVDQMVACYGRALRVLSEQWPVTDGDTPVSPVRAMNEASRVVSEHQIRRITENRLTVDDLDPESAMALTLFGIWGMGEFPFDDALSISKSLNITMSFKPGGYRTEGRMIGMNQDSRGRGSAGGDAPGFHAPLIRRGSKLRLAGPGERNPGRLSDPLTDWDILQGVIQEYRKGDIPRARPYLETHAGDRGKIILDLLHVWAAEGDSPELRQEARGILFGFRGYGNGG